MSLCPINFDDCSDCVNCIGGNCEYKEQECI